MPDRPSAPDLPPDSTTEDRYTVLGELARGGFGQVLEATDEALGRQVAIKQVISPSGEALARFEREAKLTARLQHAGVVPVYDLGRWPDGKPFFVMKKVDGRSLADLIGQARTPEARLALLPRVLAAADTMAYAHSRGVIHRDLKPSNVVVGQFGETLVIDWGLAKVLSGRDPSDEDLPGAGTDPALTETGRVLGTLPFMPPEQAQGHALDERADVYALGAMLYNVLAGEHPYAGEPAAALIAKVRLSRPVPLRVRAPDVPDDLAAIVEKAMARAPGDRYANAGDLAEDLRRYSDGQLVRAHHYPPAALLARWLRRHRAAVTVALVLFAMAAVAGVLAVRRIVAERNQAVVARRAVESRENALTLLHAQRNLPDEPTAVLAWLKRYRPTPEQGWLAATIADEAVALGVARHVFEFPMPTPAVALSPGAPLLAAGGSDGGLGLYDLGSGHRTELERHPGAITEVAFAPGGGGLASADALGNLRLWSRAGQLLHRLSLGRGPVHNLAFSGDGGQLAVALERQKVILLQRRDPAQRTVFTMPAQLNGLAFCPGSGGLVALDREGRVRVLDRGGRAFRLLAGKHTQARMFCLPDGRRLVTGGFDGAVQLWDLQAGAVRVLGRHDDWVTTIVASPDGSLVATGGGDDTVRIFALHGGPGHVLRGHRDMIRGLVFSRDGERLASVGFDSGVRVWDVASGELLRENRAPRPGTTRLELTADGSHLVASGSREARVWPLDAPGSLTLRGHAGPVTFLAWSADGQVLASTSRDLTVRTWNAASGKPLWTSAPFESWTMFTGFLRPHQLLVSTRLGRNQLIDLRSGATLQVAPPGSMWAVPQTGSHRLAYENDGRGMVADLTTGTRVPLEGAPQAIKALLFSADGKEALVGTQDGVLGRWRTDDGRVIRRHQLAEPIYGLALSPDRRLAALVTANNRLLMWDLPADRLVEVPTDHVRGDSLSFTADSRTLVYRAWDGTIRLIDASAHTSRTLRGHRSHISHLTSADRGPFHLASGDVYGFVRLWNLTTGATAVVQTDQGAVDTIFFSPDGRSLATSGEAATIRIWRLDTLPTSRSAERDLTWLTGHTTVVIDQARELHTP